METVTARIQKQLHTGWLGRQMYYFEQTDSTNTQAELCAREGAAHGTVILAGSQTAGKGSRGRSWESREGDGIFMSMILRLPVKPVDAVMVTPVAAYSTAKVLKEAYGLDVRIKWPNDIVLNRRKVVGILTSLQLHGEEVSVVVGIGVNVNTKGFAPELRDKATSLSLESGIVYDKEEMTAKLLDRLEKDYEAFFRCRNLSFLKDEYEDLLINRREQVRILRNGGEYTGTALGINDRGELLVRWPEGTVEAIYAGEVSVRGLYSYV